MIFSFFSCLLILFAAFQNITSFSYSFPISFFPFFIYSSFLYLIFCFPPYVTDTYMLPFCFGTFPKCTHSRIPYTFFLFCKIDSFSHEIFAQPMTVSVKSVHHSSPILLSLLFTCTHYSIIVYWYSLNTSLYFIFVFDHFESSDPHFLSLLYSLSSLLIKLSYYKIILT